jgi:hypothetical protein
VSARTRTPDRVETTEDGRKRTVVTMQRCCNGCGEALGDVTDYEVNHAIAGLPLPDVRGECPRCSTGGA